MKVMQYEQSGFILTTDAGYTLAVDIGSYTPIEKIQGITVDAMMVSHFHGDHFSEAHIKALSPKKLYLSQECIDLLQEKSSSEIVKISSGERFQVENMSVTTFGVDHGPNIKVIPKENFGFLISADGITIYFAGDMFYPSGIDVTNLSVDYVLIPVGTFYTFGPQEALSFIKQFKSIGTVIPMHYHKTPQTKDEFTRLAQEAGFNVIS